MAIHIPPDMIPRMDWNAEDKQAGMGLLQGEAGAVLCDCWHSQGSQGDPYSLLWWQGGFRMMDSLEGPGRGEQR